MISEEEFDILTFIKQNTDGIFDFNGFCKQNKQVLNNLLDKKLIREDFTPAHLSLGFFITIDGDQAYEEYLAFTEKQNTDSKLLLATNEANDIAREANKIATEANSLSETANNISSKAKNISLGSMIFSGISILISIASIIVAVCI